MTLREMASVYLTDADILAALLHTGPASRARTLARAQALLDTCGSLRGVMEADSRALGRRTHARLQAAFELVRRVMEETLRRGDNLTSPTITRDYLRSRLRPHGQEVFAVLFLDNRHRLIAFEELFYGSIESASVHPREVVKRALHHNAAALICSHNHPSGHAEPSQADIQLTQCLRQALAFMGIRLLDHVVVGDADVVSLAERGLL